MTRTFLNASFRELSLSQCGNQGWQSVAMGHEPPRRTLPAVTGLHPIPATPSRAWGGGYRARSRLPRRKDVSRPLAPGDSFGEGHTPCGTTMGMALSLAPAPQAGEILVHREILSLRCSSHGFGELSHEFNETLDNRALCPVLQGHNGNWPWPDGQLDRQFLKSEAASIEAER